MIKNNPEISVSALTQKITKLLREGIGEVRVLGCILWALYSVGIPLNDLAYIYYNWFYSD